MQRLLNLYLLCILIAGIHLTSFAQTTSTIWAPIQNHQLASKQALAQQNMPSQFQAYRLASLTKLEQQLLSAPLRFSEAAKQSPVQIALPMPDGRMEDFSLFNFPVMQPQLAAAYPDLRTFTAAGINNPHITAKIEMTPRGFFAMIMGDPQGAVFINPYHAKDQTYYAFYEKDLEEWAEPFICEVEESDETEAQLSNVSTRSRAGDCQLRQYRLALACTGEYAQYHDDGDDTNGEILADAMAALVVTIDRVNGIFERDAGITMIIVDRNTDIMFTDPETDPYTDRDASEMINENVPTCTNIIGPENYDIGHVFGSGGGGLAFLRSPCRDGKARGASGQGKPLDSPSAIRTAAHEIGHQYGARHTHNNNCFRSTSASYEPGSGSTIMSYAGICPPLIQVNVDHYFHANSIEEMSNFITTIGDGCATVLSSANNSPIADAGQDYTIPISTPFVLNGTASDPDGDPLTYSWEQWDREFAPMPPEDTIRVGPAFRFLIPSTSPQRYCPRLSTLVGLNTDIWEVLPSVSRELNFRLIVRDNNNAYGCTSESNMTVSTDDSAGPFTITYPDTSIVWISGETETITWDVANTDIAPISCANVDIFYSIDGGLTFPNTLATDVPNNGSYSFTVPDESSSLIRFMVKCSDNIFFAISELDIAIGIRQVCVQLNSTDIPITISDTGGVTITSELEVDLEQTILDINVINLKGTHEYLGDLRFELVSPSGDRIILINPFCAAMQDFDLGLDDNGNTLSCPYNDGQIAFPIEPLSTFTGINSSGIWALEINDRWGPDGGELLSWGLEICYEEELALNTRLLDLNATIELAPNPMNDYLNVFISSEESLEGQLQVLNTVGQVLEQVDFRSEGHDRHQLQLAHLPAGVYFLKVADKKGGQTLKKFIKQ